MAEKTVLESIRNLSELTEIIEDRSHQTHADEAAKLVGASFISHVYELCEALLNVVCWDYTSENGTLAFPHLKDLKKEDFDGPFIIPSDVRYAVEHICEIKNDCDRGKSDLNTGIIYSLVIFAGIFIKYLSVISSGETSGLVNSIIDRFCRIEEGVRHMNSMARDESRERAHAFHMIVFKGNVSEDDFTDEQLDKIYRIRTRNSNKHLAIIEIFEILKRRAASPENRIGVKEVQNILEEECGIYLERKAVSRNLVQLEEAGFICRGYEENGYWYDESIYNDRLPDH